MMWLSFSGASFAIHELHDAAEVVAELLTSLRVSAVGRGLESPRSGQLVDEGERRMVVSTPKNHEVDVVFLWLEYLSVVCCSTSLAGFQ